LQTIKKQSKNSPDNDILRVSAIKSEKSTPFEKHQKII